MFVYITNADKSMYVNELRGVVYVSWVASVDKQHAAKFPAKDAEHWVKIIASMTGVACVATSPRQPGML